MSTLVQFVFRTLRRVWPPVNPHSLVSATVCCSGMLALAQQVPQLQELNISWCAGEGQQLLQCAAVAAHATCSKQQLQSRLLPC
jgi:hypothetical protein